jgi:crossover junction endodeoxyribonuclease RuvC
MNPLYLGIDPGLRGGVAVLDGIGAVVLLRTMPLAGREVDGAELGRMVRGLRDLDAHRDIRLAAVEHVGSMPGQGVASTFAFGAGWGVVRGVLAALGVPMQLVRPPAWKKAILAGLTHDKDGACRFCAARWPGTSLILPRCRTPHDGLADALCLAEWARLKNQGMSGERDTQVSKNAAVSNSAAGPPGPMTSPMPQGTAPITDRVCFRPGPAAPATVQNPNSRHSAEGVLP